MPPKKAAPAAAAAAPAAPELTPEQQAERLMLIEECKRLRDLRIQEQADFAGMSEDKERLNLLWAQTKKQLEDTKSDVRERDRQRIALSEEHAAEIKLHKQRIKHLLFEHQAEAVDKQGDGKVVLKLAQEAQADSERELKADTRDLKVVLKELETSHDDLVRAMRQEQDRVITDLRLQFEREARELQAQYDDKMTRTREELGKDTEEDIRAIERRKTRHISALIASHEKAFNDIKLYYNEITHSNLDLIKSLKEEVEDLKKKEAGDEKVMYSIAAENKKMSEPMRKALDEVRRLRDARDVYRRDIQALHEAKASILVVQDRLENMRWEHEILDQRFQRLSGERDELYSKFTAALHEVKQKAGFKQLLLEERVAAASTQAERAGIMLSEVLAAANIGGAAASSMANGGSEATAKALGEEVAARDAMISALKTELQRVASQHDAAVRTCLEAMARHNVHPAEVGFVPLSSRDILGQSSAATGGI